MFGSTLSMFHNFYIVISTLNGVANGKGVDTTNRVSLVRINRDFPEVVKR